MDRRSAPRELGENRGRRDVGLGVREFRLRVDGAYRVFYVATREEAVYVLHAFEKKTQKTTRRDLELGRERFAALR